MKFKTERKLQLLCAHQLHGTITGLAALRTIESSVDGLDRLLVSFKDAKVCFIFFPRLTDCSDFLDGAARVVQG